MRILPTLTLSLLAVLLAPAADAAADERTPTQVVRETADTLTARVEGRQQELAASPGELYKLVGDVFLPVFDTDYAGRLVMGKHWRTATPASASSSSTRSMISCSAVMHGTCCASRRRRSGFCRIPVKRRIPSGLS